MYYNRYPNRNVKFLLHIRKIIGNIDGKSLALTPFQLSLKLSGGREMCERCMKTKEEQIEWDATHKLTGGREMKKASCGHDEYFTTNGICTKCSIQEHVDTTNEVEVARAKSKAVLHHKLGVCPQCSIGNLWAVCTVKNFETEDYSPECDYCNYVESD